MPDDANTDPFRPPVIPTEVCCLHCQREYDSYLIEWRVETCADGEQRGFWCCPTPGCGGRGFCFDIFPTDPEYRDEDGNLIWSDDDDDEDDDEESDDDFEDEDEDEDEDDEEGYEDDLPSNGTNGSTRPPAPDDGYDIPY